MFPRFIVTVRGQRTRPYEPRYGLLVSGLFSAVDLVWIYFITPMNLPLSFALI